MNPTISQRSLDAGWDAHRAAVAHLMACADAMFAEEESDAQAEAASPAVGPYCGCTDCDVREIPAVAWPILLADAAAIAESAGHGAAAELLRAEIARIQAAVPSYANGAPGSGAPGGPVVRTGAEDESTSG